MKEVGARCRSLAAHRGVRAEERAQGPPNQAAACGGALRVHDGGGTVGRGVCNRPERVKTREGQANRVTIYVRRIT